MQKLLLRSGLLLAMDCGKQPAPTPAPAPTPTLLGRWKLQDNQLLMTPTTGQPYSVPVYLPSDSTFITFTPDEHYLLDLGKSGQASYPCLTTASDYTVTFYGANRNPLVVKQIIQRLTAKELASSYTKEEVVTGAVVGTSTGTHMYVRRN